MGNADNLHGDVIKIQTQYPSKSPPSPSETDSDDEEDSLPVESEVDHTVKLIMFSKMEELNSKNIWLVQAYAEVEKGLHSILKNLGKANDLAVASRFHALRRLLMRIMRCFKKATKKLTVIIQTCHRLGRLLSWIQDYVQLEGDRPLENVVNVKELDRNIGTVATKFIAILGQILESIEVIHRVLGD